MILLQATMNERGQGEGGMTRWHCKYDRSKFGIELNSISPRFDGRDIDSNGAMNVDEVDRSDDWRVHYLTRNSGGLMGVIVISI